MDAAPRLVEIADAFADAQLEAILIGNAGAALQGAPVTTLDFDFLYRPSAINETKLRKVAQTLGGHLSQPFPTGSKVYRILRPDNQLQIDLTSQLLGIGSFNRLRSHAARVEIDGRTIVVASLADIAKIEKQRTAHQTSRCSMSSNERSQKKTPRPPTKRQLALEAMRQASEDELTALIRRQLALPMNQRTHFLRLRLPNGGSCL